MRQLFSGWTRLFNHCMDNS